MISLVTKYLLQYKRVSIPHIGSFELVQEPPQLRVADHLFAPPSFTTAYLKLDEVPEHQSRFFSAAGDLSTFGQQLRNRLRKGPIQWKGFGTLRTAADEIVFEPQLHSLSSLQPIPAKKVIRPDAAHSVLVGNTEVVRQAVVEAPAKYVRRSPEMTIGLILLVLSVAAIIFILYRGEFSPAAAGTRFPAYF